jgi:hypothetical protein
MRDRIWKHVLEADLAADEQMNLPNQECMRATAGGPPATRRKRVRLS